MTVTLRKWRPAIIFALMLSLTIFGIAKCEGKGPHPFSTAAYTTTCAVKVSDTNYLNRNAGWDHMLVHHVTCNREVREAIEGKYTNRDGITEYKWGYGAYVHTGWSKAQLLAAEAGWLRSVIKWGYQVKP